MIVTTITHSGVALATAADVAELLGDTAKVGIYRHDDGSAHVTITRTNADGVQHAEFLPPHHRLISSDGGATFRIEQVVLNPAHEIVRLERAVDVWRSRWLEEAAEVERLHGVVAELEARLTVGPMAPAGGA